MDTRMKEILNAFKNNKLTPDSSFRFHCTQCGKCCINRDDIILSPLDLFRIAKELNLSMEEVLKQYCDGISALNRGSQRSALSQEAVSDAARS